MATTLIAMKRIRYPRGPDAREHSPGDEFESLSDKDTKTLTKARLARFKSKDGAPEYARRDMIAEDSSSSPRRAQTRRGSVAPMSTENAAALEAESSKRVYRRRDLTSEE